MIRRWARDLPWTVGAVAASAIAVGLYGWLVVSLLRAGTGRLSWRLAVEVPTDAGRAGGLAPVIASTAVLVTIALAVAVPAGVAGGAYLAIGARRAGRRDALRGVLDLLAAMPSVVFGLLGATLFADILGLGYSLLSGGLTLGVMILPLVVRATDVALTSLPGELTRDAAALALSRWTTLRRVLLPAAAPALGAGVMLALGRALAETAALIFTSGYVDRWPSSVFDSGRALSVHILDLAMNVPGGDPSANAAAVVLLVAVVVIDLLALAIHWRVVRRPS